MAQTGSTPNPFNPAAFLLDSSCPETVGVRWLKESYRLSGIYAAFVAAEFRWRGPR
jgi:hypothetical protein